MQNEERNSQILKLATINQICNYMKKTTQNTICLLNTRKELIDLKSSRDAYMMELQRTGEDCSVILERLKKLVHWVSVARHMDSPLISKSVIDAIDIEIEMSVNAIKKIESQNVV